MARLLLSSPPARSDLSMLSDIARSSATGLAAGDHYTEVGEPFCDGFKIALTDVRHADVLSHRTAINNAIVNVVQDWQIKNNLIQRSGDKTTLWLSLEPGCSQVDHMTIRRLFMAEQAVQNFSRASLRHSICDEPSAAVVKIDFTQDYMGSFLPLPCDGFGEPLRPQIQRIVEDCLRDVSTPFLRPIVGSRAKVRIGKNNLDTCWQFDICDLGGKKAATLKIYDKVLDLVARDGCELVGSRCRELLGSRTKLDAFHTKLR